MPYKFKIYIDSERAREHYEDGMVWEVEMKEEPTIDEVVSSYIEYITSIESEDDLELIGLKWIVAEAIANWSEFSVKLDLQNSSV